MTEGTVTAIAACGAAILGIINGIIARVNAGHLKDSKQGITEIKVQINGRWEELRREALRVAGDQARHAFLEGALARKAIQDQAPEESSPINPGESV